MIEKPFDYFFLFFLLWTNSNQNDLCWKFIFEEIFETNKQSCLYLSHFTIFLCFLQQALKYSSYTTHTEKKVAIMSLSLEWGEDMMASLDRGQWMMMRGWDQSLAWHWRTADTALCQSEAPQRLGRGGRHWSTAEAPLSLAPSLGLSVYSH